MENFDSKECHQRQDNKGGRMMNYVKYGTRGHSILVISGMVLGFAIIFIPTYLIWQIEQASLLGKLIIMAIYFTLLKLTFGR